MTKNMNRCYFLRRTLMTPLVLLTAVILMVAPSSAEPLTLRDDQRPQWLARDGIVMAGSWEPLMFRVRRDGAPGYTPTPEQQEAYQREHSPEMVARLKDLGVNFVMMHCYKGAGLKAEAQSMQDAVKFSRLCHEAGMRVGVYNFSGTFLWELFFKEVPEAKDWVLSDVHGKPLTAFGTTYRYCWNRNQPAAQAFHKKILRFAVEEVQTDLVHLDNYMYGPGYDDCSAGLFRRYLRDTFSPKRLAEMRVDDVDNVRPPVDKFRETLLGRAWQDFCCQALADSYQDMSRYARSLRKDILMECNPNGPSSRIWPPVDLGVDHGRVLRGGEAFWDEGGRSGMHDGHLTTAIRTYKIARRMNNMAFRYIRNPLEAAEAMAFNQDCLGCICWFEYGKITNYPGRSGEPIDRDLGRFVRFFHARRDLLRNAKVVADVAVLRDFSSQVFAPQEHARLTGEVEEALIENRGCFQIIYDHHLAELNGYKALVLAGCVAISDKQAEQIRRYVDSGGRLCIIGPVGTHDGWMRPRKQPALGSLPRGRVVEIDANGDWLVAIRRACVDQLSLAVSGPVGLCTELTEQTGRPLVHLVNYRPDGPVENVKVNLRLPEGRRAMSLTLVSPERDRSLDISFQQECETIQFTVPSVGVYEIAIVTLEP